MDPNGTEAERELTPLTLALAAATRSVGRLDVWLVGKRRSAIHGTQRQQSNESHHIVCASSSLFLHNKK